MTKQELIDLVNMINATWPPPEMDQKAVYNTWWRYLGDLELQQVQPVVDELIIESSPWRPKVGEVRRRAIDGGNVWPSPDAAWELAEACRRAADTGIEVPGLPDGVAGPLGECMRGSRFGGKAGFLELWKQKTAERYMVQKYE